MQTFLRLLHFVDGLFTKTETAFHHIFPSLKNGELLTLPMPADPTEFLIETFNANSAGIASATSTLKPRVMTKRLLFFGTFMSVLFLTMAFTTTSFGQATVTSDADDYAPRSTATFTGAGFQPGEEVILKVKNLSYPCNTVFADSSYLPWTVVADDNGGFITQWLVCECPGDSLRLKATGQVSGSIAYAYFLDNQLGNNAVSIGTPSLATGTGFYGSATVFDYVVSVTSSNGGSANLSSVTLSMTTFPTGITSPNVQFLPSNILTFGAATSTQTATVRITTQANTPIPSSPTFTVTATPITGTARAANGTLTINPAVLTAVITAPDKFYDGTTAATLSTQDVTGEVNGEIIGLSGGTATFSDKNIGVNKTVTATGFTLTGSKAANYVLSSSPITTTATIKPKELIAIFTVANKTYDGNTTATITDRQLSGVISGETNKVDLNGGTATFDTKDVGAGKTVTVAGPMNLSGTFSGNYVIGSVGSSTAAITFRTATIVFTVADKVYNGTTSATIVSAEVPSATIDALHGLIAGDDVDVDFSTATVAFGTSSVGTGKTVTATGFKLTGADGPSPGNGNYQVNIVTQFTSTGTITPATLTVAFTASNKVYDGTNVATILTRTLTGIVAADLTPSTKVAAGGGTATFSDKNVDNGKTVTASGFTLTGSSKDNYIINPNSGITTTANITPRALLVTATGVNKIYDGTTAATVTLSDGPNATLTLLDDRVAGDVFTTTYTTALFLDKNVANAKTVNVSGISISGLDAGNYTFNATATATANITARALTVSATGVNKVYDGLTTATVNLSDGPNETVTLLDDRVAGDIFTTTYTSAAFVDKNVANNITINVSGISISGLDAGNYTFNTTATTSANITVKTLYITAKNQTKSYGQVFTFAGTEFTTPTSEPGKLVAGEAIASVTLTSTGSPASATVLGSPYDIIAKDAVGDASTLVTNYAITYYKGTLTINAAVVTPVVTLSVNPQQYSDNETFTATIPGGAPTGALPAATTVCFKVGTQIMGTTSFTVSGTDLVASLSRALVEPSPFGTAPTGQMAPGAHTVTATITGNDPNYNFTTLAPTTTLNITQEDARVTYTGPMSVATSSSSSTSATVTLSATIQDITATADASGDILFGDIRNAKVKFVNRDNGLDISGWLSVGLVNSADIKTGTVVYNWTGATSTQGLYSIGIVVGAFESGVYKGYYTRNSSSDNFVVSIYQPNGDFITGGGYIMLANSNGIKAGDVGSKNNFGFNIKYNKGGTNLQGTINTIFRRTESGVVRTYQIKGNAMTSLSVDPSVTATHPYPTAIFNGKANITDITNPLSPITIDAGTLQVTMADAGEPGTGDSIGLVVYNKLGGVYFATNWNGVKNVNQLLSRGNLVVHSSAAVSATVATKSVVSTVDPSTAMVYDKFLVRVLGNPSTSYFTVQVLSNTYEPVELLVFDINGSKVRQYRGAVGESFKVGHSLTQGTYFIQVLQGKNKSVTKVIKN